MSSRNPLVSPAMVSSIRGKPVRPIGAATRSPTGFTEPGRGHRERAGRVVEDDVVLPQQPARHQPLDVVARAESLGAYRDEGADTGEIDRHGAQPHVRRVDWREGLPVFRHGLPRAPQPQLVGERLRENEGAAAGVDEEPRHADGAVGFDEAEPTIAQFVRRVEWHRRRGRRRLTGGAEGKQDSKGHRHESHGRDTNPSGGSHAVATLIKVGTDGAPGL